MGTPIILAIMGTPIILAMHISSIHMQTPSKLMGVLNQPCQIKGVLIQSAKLWVSSFSRSRGIAFAARPITGRAVCRAERTSEVVCQHESSVSPNQALFGNQATQAV